MRANGEVVERVQRLFREGLSIDVPSQDTDLIDAGLLDSLALVELLHQLEEEFEFEIPLDRLEIENFRTAERIADFVSASGARRTGTT